MTEIMDASENTTSWEDVNYKLFNVTWIIRAYSSGKSYVWHYSIHSGPTIKSKKKTFCANILYWFDIYLQLSYIYSLTFSTKSHI